MALAKCDPCSSCCVSEWPQWQGTRVFPQAGLWTPEPGGMEGLVCPALPPCSRLQPHLCHLFLTPMGRYVHSVSAQLPERLISVHAYPFLQLMVKSPLLSCYIFNRHAKDIVLWNFCFRVIFFQPRLNRKLVFTRGCWNSYCSIIWLYVVFPGQNNCDCCWCWIILMLVTRNLVHILFWNGFTLCLT